MKKAIIVIIFALVGHSYAGYPIPSSSADTDAIQRGEAEDMVVSTRSYSDATPYVVRMSEFSTNVTDWTTDTTVAWNAAAANGMQMDYYTGASLSISGGEATLTATSAGYRYLRLFADAVPLRGKKINVIIEGDAGTNAVLNVQARQIVGGSVDSTLTYTRHPSVTAGASFAKQFQYVISPNATVVYVGVSQNLASGDSLTISRMDVSLVESWEDEPIIGASRLRNTRSWINDLKKGVCTNNLNIAVIGDSWTVNDRIATNLYATLTEVCRAGELGFVGWQNHFGGGGYPDDAVSYITRSGTWDNTFSLVSMDQSGVTASGSGNVLTNTTLAFANGNLISDRVRVYYDGTQTGAFRWRTFYDNTIADGVDGNGPWIVKTAWTTNTLTGAGDKWDYIEDGITAYYSKRIEVETLSGTLVFYGAWWKNENTAQTHPGGFTIHKAGKSGGYCYNWADVSTGANSAYQREALSQHELDLVILVWGTNDQLGYQGGNSSVPNMYKDYRNYLNNLRTALGDNVDIMIVTPAINPSTRENTGPMYQYRNMQHSIAQEYDCCYVNLIPTFGNDPADYADGTDLDYFKSDDLHPEGEGLTIINDTISDAMGLDEVRLINSPAITKTVSADDRVGNDDWREAYGGHFFVTSAATVSVPFVGEPGMRFKVTSLTASAVNVDSVAWGPAIYLDGVQLDRGDKATVSSAGATLEIVFDETSGWVATGVSGAWSDGGP